jgi:murein DD-endopeptidase MepM/ murein hydrolase activator NlpD
MRLTARIARVRIADYEFQSGDGYLLPNIEIQIGESDRASSARFSISDPGLLIGAEFMKISIAQGGIITPPDLLKDPSKSTGAASVPSSGAQGNAPILAEVAKAFEGGSNSLIARAVGHSEGNRTAEGGFNGSYKGHTDPGNGAYNIGSFSYQAKQGGASTPEQADELWMGKLKAEMPKYEAAAKAAGLNPADSRLLANFCDLYTQSPAAATEQGGFLDRMGEIAKGGGSYEAIIAARVNSYRNPSNGAINAPGFGNSESRLKTDQDRRMTALEAVLKRAGAGTPPAPTGNIQAKMTPAAVQPTGTQPVTAPTGPTSAPIAQATPAVESSIKGTEVIIELGYTPSSLIAFHFIHTGTTCKKEGAETTTFEGKSLRWLLTRVPQTRSFEAVNLKQVAQILSESLGAKVEFEGKGQTYQHLDMTGLTPFRLLSREAKSIGYRIADKGNKLILEPEARPEFTDFVIDEDVLISADFGDQARADGPSPGTATSQSDGAAGTAKSVLNLQSGQTTTLTPNTTAGTGKPTGDTAVIAGAAAAAVGGTVKQPGGAPAAPEAAKSAGPEKRKVGPVTVGDTTTTEEITIERKEEPTQVTTTTTTVATIDTVTVGSGTRRTKTTIETKVGTAKGTTITTKVTDGNNAPVTTTSTTADIDAKFTSKTDPNQNAQVDQFGLPKQPPGIIDLADGRAEGLQIADESKRIKGYESSAVLMSTEEVLQLVPGQIIALSSRLFPEPFDREWRIADVRHSWGEGTTTLNFYTPQLPPPSSGGSTAATTATSVPTGKILNPHSDGGQRGTPFDPSGVIRGRPHNGIDTLGDYSIRAGFSGTVIDAENSCRVGDSECGGRFGNLVYIAGEGEWAGYTLRYAHLASAAVTKNQKVAAGQVVGQMGDTGASDGDHLHMELLKGDQRIDPEPYISPCFTAVYGQGSGTPLKCKG